jgi:hypothetical protein
MGHANTNSKNITASTSINGSNNSAFTYKLLNWGDDSNQQQDGDKKIDTSHKIGDFISAITVNGDNNKKRISGKISHISKDNFGNITNIKINIDGKNKSVDMSSIRKKEIDNKLQYQINITESKSLTFKEFCKLKE